MTNNYIGPGEVINVSATAGCTEGEIWIGDQICGVFLATYSAASTNTAVPVALEGVFTVRKKVHSDAWAVGEKIYAQATGGNNVAVAAATGSAIAIGIAVAVAATGASTGNLKLCTF